MPMGVNSLFLALCPDIIPDGALETLNRVSQKQGKWPTHTVLSIQPQSSLLLWSKCLGRGDSALTKFSHMNWAQNSGIIFGTSAVLGKAWKQFLERTIYELLIVLGQILKRSTIRASLGKKKVGNKAFSGNPRTKTYVRSCSTNYSYLIMGYGIQGCWDGWDMRIGSPYPIVHSLKWPRSTLSCNFKPWVLPSWKKFSVPSLLLHLWHGTTRLESLLNPHENEWCDVI